MVNLVLKGFVCRSTGFSVLDDSKLYELAFVKTSICLKKSKHSVMSQEISSYIHLKGILLGTPDAMLQN